MVKLALVGIGVIARSQHLPTLAASKDFELVAAVSRNATVDGVRNFKNVRELIAGAPDVEAVSLCTPPVGRAADARLALEAGLHVMLEKPPGATVSEVTALADLARAQKRTLFATWHSRCAAGVEPARAWLAKREVKRVDVAWKEDVRYWHPGQEWIFAAGGLGVFDPAINAISVLTRILPRPFALEQAVLSFPSNRDAPIAATLDFADTTGAPIHADLDFLQTGPPTWDIRVATNDGELLLSEGAGQMAINGVKQIAPSDVVLHGEYTQLYRDFARLIAASESDADVTPLQHVADSFLLGRRVNAPPFDY